MTDYVWGMISPGPTTASEVDLAYRPPRLLPGVRQIVAGLSTSKDEVWDEATRMSRYWECVDELVQRGAQRIVLGGVQNSCYLGRAAVLELLAETTRRT
ncbi:MAG: hypothetical protein ACHQ7M_23640, partial [Chloroflexota bacterium]